VSGCVVAELVSAHWFMTQTRGCGQAAPLRAKILREHAEHPRLSPAKPEHTNRESFDCAARASRTGGLLAHPPIVAVTETPLAREGICKRTKRAAISPSQ